MQPLAAMVSVAVWFIKQVRKRHVEDVVFGEVAPPPFRRLDDIADPKAARAAVALTFGPSIFGGGI